MFLSVDTGVCAGSFILDSCTAAMSRLKLISRSFSFQTRVAPTGSKLEGPVVMTGNNNCGILRVIVDINNKSINKLAMDQ